MTLKMHGENLKLICHHNLLSI